MLFSYEMKKIWRRVSPLIVLITLSATVIITLILTMVLPFKISYTPIEYKNVDTAYAALETKIQNWNTTNIREQFSIAFDTFYNDYEIMNASTLYDTDHIVDKYHEAQTTFNQFYLDYYLHPTYGIYSHYADYLLVRSEYNEKFSEILSTLNEFFTNNYSDRNDIVRNLSSTNPTWEDASLKTILENLFYVQKIKSEDLAELKAFFNTHPAGQVGYDYTDAYDYAINRFYIAVNTGSTYVGKLSQYAGFEDYRDTMTSTRACNLAEYRIEHADEDFAIPFEFGNIYNNSNQISLFDFVFTNLEMAMIPISLLVMVWAACTFFTDNNQNTLITPVTAGKHRSTIILTKTAVILLLMVMSLLILTGIYITIGLLFFRAYVSPDILFLFNGTTPIAMSSANYFAVYFLNLVFKLLPLIALCGLFSFIKSRPFVIVGFTALIYVGIILCNQLLGWFWFYQFVPLMGLDPMRYFGAKLLFAPMPSTYNLWYTFPIVVCGTAAMYWTLIHIFRHHDF